MSRTQNEILRCRLIAAQQNRKQREAAFRPDARTGLPRQMDFSTMHLKSTCFGRAS